MIAAALELEAELYVEELRHLRDGQGYVYVWANGVHFNVPWKKTAWPAW